jgi:hypothetical protein
MKSFRTAGNVKLRGRKTCVMSCRCCVNVKDEIMRKHATKEVLDFKKYGEQE